MVLMYTYEQPCLCLSCGHDSRKYQSPKESSWEQYLSEGHSALACDSHMLNDFLAFTKQESSKCPDTDRDQARSQYMRIATSYQSKESSPPVYICHSLYS